MELNEKMIDRVREIIAAKKSNVEEKKMFSGLTFMVNRKMCVSVVSKQRIMVRLSPEAFEEALITEGCVPMIKSGTIMKGFIYVNEEILTTKKKLEHWVNLALDFNKFAKATNKKSKQKL
jgi:TfoX/Sxy family transcriptional regulator of competence genes